jgi:hypothetical protein
VKGPVAVTTSNALPSDSLLPVPAPVDTAGSTLPAASNAAVVGGGTFALLIDRGNSPTADATVQLPPEADGVSGEKKDTDAAIAQMGLAAAFAPAPVPVMVVLATDAGQLLATCAPVSGETSAAPRAASKDSGDAGINHADERISDVVGSVRSVPASDLRKPQPSTCEAPPETVGQDPQSALPAETKPAPVPMALPDTNANAAATITTDEINGEEIGQEDIAGGEAEAPTEDGSGASTAPAKDAGMRSASIPVPMKMTAKTERNADPAEQNLPHRQIVPEPVARPVEALTERPKSDASVPRIPQVSNTAQIGSPAIAATRAVATEPSRASEVLTPAVDRLAQVITEQVLSFKRAGNSSFDVSVRPDRGTELSLHLTLRDGQVEVIARLERGQFETLQLHWGELQQTLAQQGVRVGQLMPSSAMTDQSQSQFLPQGSDGQAQRRFEQSPESLDELPLGGAPTEPLHRRGHKPTPAMRRGWEMWA